MNDHGLSFSHINICYVYLIYFSFLFLLEKLPKGKKKAVLSYHNKHTWICHIPCQKSISGDTYMYVLYTITYSNARY